SDDQADEKAQTPEPGEVITTPDVGESPEPDMTAAYQYENYEANWGSYDPTAAWDDTADQQEDTNAAVQDTTIGASEVEIDDYVKSLVGKTCQTLYPYEGQSGDELSFVEGEILQILAVTDNDWATAQNSKDEVGFVPIAFVQVLEDAVASYVTDESYAAQENEANTQQVENIPDVQVNVESNAEYVRAAYDYTATSDEEISFQDGDLIRIIERSEDGWWLGEKDGVTGHFPSMLVHELDEVEPEGVPFEAESDSGENSGEGTPEFVATPSGGPPPPSFAPPPQPAFLAPTQVVIIQATPDVESKTFPNEEIAATNSCEEEEEIADAVDEPEYEPVIIDEPDPDFCLSQPVKKQSEDETEVEIDEGCEGCEKMEEEIEHASAEISEINDELKAVEDEVKGDTIDSKSDDLNAKQETTIEPDQKLEPESKSSDCTSDPKQIEGDKEEEDGIM
ncbi:FCH and double SH3 domains protein 2-like protein, partial [Leptotrombidium deliense]